MIITFGCFRKRKASWKIGINKTNRFCELATYWLDQATTCMYIQGISPIQIFLTCLMFKCLNWLLRTIAVQITFDKSKDYHQLLEGCMSGLMLRNPLLGILQRLLPCQRPFWRNVLLHPAKLIREREKHYRKCHLPQLNRISTVFFRV